MNDRRLGMAVRARRHRRGWRLVDLAAAAGVGATACSLFERGFVARLSIPIARSIAGAVDLPLDWDVGWRRQEIDRLLDEDHSALAGLVTRRLERWGWVVRSEVSFNRYGDRGRIDLLAYQPMPRTLLVIEIKTAIVDGQALVGGLDVKARVAGHVAREMGWDPLIIAPALIISDGTTARRRVARLEPLLNRYTLRGKAALAWLREPIGSPTGLLMLSQLPANAGSDVRRAGRRRVRLQSSKLRSVKPPPTPKSSSMPS
ncbi:MAG: helix-turn-helix domain-containing protein [Chloroflexota bacterium]